MKLMINVNNLFKPIHVKKVIYLKQFYVSVLFFLNIKLFVNGERWCGLPSEFIGALRMGWFLVSHSQTLPLASPKTGKVNEWFSVQKEWRKIVIEFKYSLYLYQCSFSKINTCFIFQGILLLKELFNSHPDGKRDYLFYLAIGNARIKEYNKALHYVKSFLEIEPANQQVLALEVCTVYIYPYYIM